jgi:hypothetical protein
VGCIVQSKQNGCKHKKTKYIIFHSKGKKVELNGLDLIYDDNEQGIEHDPSKVSILDRIGRVNAAPDLQSFRLLGVLLDENLTFDPHINMLLAKLSKSTFIISKVKNILPPQTLRTLYFSLFHSHLTYCPIIASCANKSSVEKIFKAQKRSLGSSQMLPTMLTQPHSSANSKSCLTPPSSLNHLFTSCIQLITNTLHLFSITPGSQMLNETRISTFVMLMTITFPGQTYPYFKEAHSTLWNTAGPSKYHQNPTTFKICLKEELLNPFLSKDVSFLHTTILTMCTAKKQI